VQDALPRSWLRHARDRAGHLNCAIPEARHLLRLYRETFPRLTAWTEAQCDQAVLSGSVSTLFGWRLLVSGAVKPTTLRNFPIQSAGAELLRLACSFATERGVAVAAPVHDALLIESDVADLDATVATTKAAMDEASRAVLDGLAVKVDVKVFRHPHRYSDKRGEALFARVYRLLGEITGRVAHAG
jgi:DNA polymerase I